MNKTIKAGALLVAGVFVLSGCGSSDGNSGSAPAESSPTPTLAVGQDQYSPDELEDALVALTEDQILTGDIENDAMLRPQFENDSFTGISITPEQCSGLLSSTFDKGIQDGNLAFGLLQDSNVLTLVSYEDASVLEEQVEGGDQVVAECADLQMENDGVQLSAGVEKIDASTDAPTTHAYRTTIDRGDAEGIAIHVMGISGTVQISVTMFDSADEAAGIAEAEEAINAVYAELEKK